MKSLKSNIDSRRGKNVDILLISEAVLHIIFYIAFDSGGISRAAKTYSPETGIALNGYTECFPYSKESVDQKALSFIFLQIRI